MSRLFDYISVAVGAQDATILKWPAHGRASCAFRSPCLLRMSGVSVTEASHGASQIVL